MANQWLLFRTAIMFLTRLPVGKNLPYSKDQLQASARYFSWVGIVVGLIGGLIFACLSFYFSPALSTVFSMLVTIIITGSFHEDGLADCCDAFGGGWSKEKILTIMKDSRLGTYGVVGLIAVLSTKFILIIELCAAFYIPFVAIIIIAAHSTSRFMAVTVMQQLPYVQDIDTSKSKPLADRALNIQELTILSLGALITLFLVYIIIAPSNLNPTPFSIRFSAASIYLFPLFIVLIMLPAIIIRYFAGRFFIRWIGGYTGDCLGATQQLCEIGFYIGCLLLWRFF